MILSNPAETLDAEPQSLVLARYATAAKTKELFESLGTAVMMEQPRFDIGKWEKRYRPKPADSK